MPTNILRAATGQQAGVDNLDDQQPNSYSTGGFSVRSSLGRINDATVSVDNGDWEARVTNIGTGDRANFANVQVYSQDGSGEAANNTDIESDTFVLRSERL